MVNICKCDGLKVEVNGACSTCLLPFSEKGESSSLYPSDPDLRKQIPLYSGLVKYFPNALAAVAKLSYLGNEQHNPGKPLHWDRSKSPDELDALMRHLVEEEWEAVAWRALANLEKQIEKGYNPQGFK